MTTIIYIAALFALACLVGGFRKAREWDDAEEQYLRTQRKLGDDPRAAAFAVRGGAESGTAAEVGNVPRAVESAGADIRGD